MENHPGQNRKWNSKCFVYIICFRNNVNCTSFYVLPSIVMFTYDPLSRLVEQVGHLSDTQHYVNLSHPGSHYTKWNYCNCHNSDNSHPWQMSWRHVKIKLSLFRVWFSPRPTSSLRGLWRRPLVTSGVDVIKLSSSSSLIKRQNKLGRWLPLPRLESPQSFQRNIMEQHTLHSSIRIIVPGKPLKPVACTINILW
jgi:hypothetical protein